MAKIEPKTSSSTIGGQQHAQPGAADGCLSAGSAIWPETATWRSGPLAVRAASTNVLRLGRGDILAC